MSNMKIEPICLFTTVLVRGYDKDVLKMDIESKELFPCFLGCVYYKQANKIKQWGPKKSNLTNIIVTDIVICIQL